ncbi:hypothetical protein [Mastigocoleus sp. MO_188.B34]|uniref:hypothetical protein n=1 Tax=Mastigocoleus sp. MO_188.B34 TaxID=3036635 RepID=UPI0026267606|nr:hypothetical protein [Mastigocoleus sp. MO_188.B34]MDJ0697035.1 hypothetical protein [Mastigocoleus sp. MO_188.B34]
MKIFFATLSFALAFLIAIPGENVWAITKSTEIAQESSKKDKESIPLGLHNVVEIILKNGSSIFGTLTGSDPQKKTVRVTPKNGTSRVVKVEEIKRIVADKKSPVFNHDGRGRIIRGEDTAEAKQSIWSNIPLDQFQIEEGKTNVDLSNVVNPKQLRGIRAVAVNSLYVVDEIEFDDSGNMTIKVTPIDQNN